MEANSIPQSVNTQNPQSAPTANNNKSSRRKYLYITAIIVAILFLICLIFLLLNFFGKPGQYIRINNHIVGASIDLNKKELVDSGYYYFFDTTLSEIRDLGDKIQLVTPIKGNEAPDFIIKKEDINSGASHIRKFQGGNNYETVGLPELKPNQKIRISMFYSFKNRTWSIPLITVW